MGSSIPPDHARPARRHRRSGAFTLLEVAIVIGIVSVLAAIAGPAYQAHLERARAKTVILDIRWLEEELAAFELEWESFPPSLDAIGAGDRRDPWGNPYRYQRIAGEALTGPDKVTPRKDKSLHPLNSDYDLYSMGPDGDSKTPLTAKASHDDIIRAGDGDFVGVAEDY
jgi:general secretion pathway protein G